MNRSLFSSKTYEWSTPQWLFDKLNAVYHFDLDVCANEENHKCEYYFNKEQDGLRKEWIGTVWMNPPYGREIGKWVKKACDYGVRGHGVAVCLLPARTDTAWWHDYCIPHGKIEFIRGRLKFNGSKNYAPFPNAIVVFGGKE